MILRTTGIKAQNDAYRTGIVFCLMVLCGALAGIVVTVTVPSLAFSLIPSTVISGLTLLAPVVIAAMREQRWFVNMSDLHISPPLMLASLVIAIAIMPFIVMVNLVTQLFSQNVISQSVDVMAQGHRLWLMILMLGIIAPVCEELVFRGYIYEHLKSYGMAASVVVSALLFALIHMNLNQFCYAVIFGVILALLKLSTGSILASMITHCVFNSIQLCLYASPSYSLYNRVMGATMIGHYKPWAFAFLLLGMIAGVCFSMALIRLMFEKTYGCQPAVYAKEHHAGSLKEMLNGPLIAGALVCGAIMIGVIK